MALQQYGRVFLQGQGREPGILKLEHSQVQWSSRSAEHSKSIASADVAGATWVGLGGRRSQLRLKVGGSSVRFDGFRREDKATIAAFLSEHYSVSLKTESVSVAGGNWGKLAFKGNVVALTDATTGNTAVEFPLNEVSLTSMPKGRPGEIEIQFQTDDTVAAKEETLVRMDLYIPTPADRADDEIFATAAEAFDEQLKDSAGIRNAMGDALIEIDESHGKFLAPHGRFAIEMYSKYMRLRGRSYDPTITYEHIDSLFVLPMPDDVHQAFVVALTTPIRQGQQRYFYLVMQLKQDETTLNFNLDEDEIAEKYGSGTGLAPSMKAGLHILIAKTFKILTGKKIFTVGKFKTSRGNKCIECALKNQTGCLFPLKRSFMFIHKPTKWIKYDDIKHVEFMRAGKSKARTFDFKITLKGASAAAAKSDDLMFKNIEKGDYDPLLRFCQQRKISIKNLKSRMDEEEAGGRGGDTIQAFDMEDADSGDDSDFEAGGDDDDETSDSDDEDYSGEESEEEKRPKKKKRKS